MKRTAAQLEANVEELVARCRAAGMNITPQRLGIYRALLESSAHPSPEALYEKVRPALPSISLATIYKTLDTLVALGFAWELPSTGDSKRFDANMDPHHHLMCRRCGGVEDFEDPALSAVKLPRRLNGFQAEHLRIHVHGLCRSCTQSTPTRENQNGQRAEGQ